MRWPSLTEGFGYTTLESCATGTPVVASDTASIPEVIHGKHVLVKPRSPMAIADGVVRVFRKRWDRTPEKKFPWAKTVLAYEKEYGRLAK